MKRSSVFALLPLPFLVLFCCQSTYAECTIETAEDFVVIDPDNYDGNFSTISSVGKRPLGFEKDIWYYNTPGEANPCFKVLGALDRRVEVMAETIPESRLCVNQEGVKIGCGDSGTGRFYTCLHSTDDTVYVEFYCDNECAEGNVQFWYRIVVGPSATEDPEDHWCEGRNADGYPSSLQTLPPNFQFPPDSTTQQPDIAASTHISCLLLVVAAVCAAIVL